AEPGAVEVYFIDNSYLKLKLADDQIELTTPYGKLRVPVAAVQRIDFASRIPEETLKRIETGIANLGSSEYQARESAATELLKLGDRAYPALLQAAKSTDVEVVRRAEQLLDKIRERVPEDLLEFRRNDVVYTEDSKIAGQIDNVTLKAHTVAVGTALAGRPPRRSGRAALPHPAPTS